MNTTELSPWLRDLIASPPRAGEGFHNWMYRVSRHLHAHLPAGEIFTVLNSAAANCGRHVSDAEIWDAIRNSLACAWQPTGKTAPVQLVSEWPVVNREQREAIIRDGGGLADLWEASPARLEDTEPHTEEIIDRLFPGNPLLCCARSQSDFETMPREDWRGQLAGLQFIVPSFMTTRTGLTRQGRPSAHTLSNTGPRRFLVCEFDTGTPDEHAAILLHLASYAPMVCALHSGGKSMHGWFLVHGQPDEKVSRFFRYAVSLGADSRMWTPCQFARMPDGTRDNGRRQSVFFLNYRPLKVHHV